MICLYINGYGLAFSQSQAHFITQELSFGQVKEEEGLVEGIFIFENRGSQPLRIREVESNCGCTVPRWSDKALKKNEQGFIKVEFDPKGRPGWFEKETKVYFYGIEEAFVLKIGGEVIPEAPKRFPEVGFRQGNLRFKSQQLVLGKVYKHEEKAVSTVLYNLGEDSIYFDFSSSRPLPFLSLYGSKNYLAPKDTMKLWARLNGSTCDAWGWINPVISFKSTDTEAPIKQIQVNAKIVERLKASAFSPKLEVTPKQVTVVAADFSPLATKTFELHNKGQSILYIRKVERFSPFILVKTQSEAIPPGQSVLMQITLKEEAFRSGEPVEALIISNDPVHPEQRVELRFRHEP